jgi:hypothetical protein
VHARGQFEVGDCSPKDVAFFVQRYSLSVIGNFDQGRLAGVTPGKVLGAETADRQLIVHFLRIVPVFHKEVEDGTLGTAKRLVPLGALPLAKLEADAAGFAFAFVLLVLHDRDYRGAPLPLAPDVEL